MNNFYSDLWILSKDFIKFELTIKELELIKSGVLEDLKLADAFKLNDRVEGIDYYERATLKTSPFIFFKKYLDIEVPYNNYGDYKRFSSININGQSYNNLVFKFGELPKIKIVNEFLDSIVIIKKDKRVFYFVGLISKNQYKDEFIDFRQIDFISELSTNHFNFLSK